MMVGSLDFKISYYAITTIFGALDFKRRFQLGDVVLGFLLFPAGRRFPAPRPVFRDLVLFRVFNGIFGEFRLALD